MRFEDQSPEEHFLLQLRVASVLSDDLGYGFTGLRHQDEISPQRNQYDTEDVKQQADVIILVA